MAIDSVSSSSSAYANAARQSSENRQAQQAERKEAKPQERAEAQQEAPKPVKNAQGQSTGTVVNTTA